MRSPGHQMQAVSLAVCAALLSGAVVFTAPEGGTAQVLDGPAEPLADDSARALRGARPSRMAMPRDRREPRQLVPEAAAMVAGSAPYANVAATPETFALGGSVIGEAPGYGQAWAVEAYRLTPERTAVLECRRVYVEPNGRLRLTGLGAGTWQTVLVSPRFAWGPLVDTGAPPAELRIDANGAGQIRLETVTDGAAPEGVRLRLSLTGVRSPALEGSAVSLQRRVEIRDVVLGEALTFEGVSEGTYEVSAMLARVEPDWGVRPRSRRLLISVGQGTTHVELAFVDPWHPAHRALQAKDVVPR